MSSVNPLLLVFEGHNVYAGSTVTDNSYGDYATSTERLNAVLDALNTKGYAPISVYDVQKYFDGKISLPKRCFTIVMDDYYYSNCLDEAKRSPFTTYGVKPAIAIITDQIQSTELIYNGNQISTLEAKRICDNYNFGVITHTRNHRQVNHDKLSDVIPNRTADVESADRVSVDASIVAYPGGQDNYYVRQTYQWMNVGLGIDIYCNRPTCIAKDKYSIGRCDIQDKEPISAILEVIK